MRYDFRKWVAATAEEIELYFDRIANDCAFTAKRTRLFWTTRTRADLRTLAKQAILNGKTANYSIACGLLGELV